LLDDGPAPPIKNRRLGSRLRSSCPGGLESKKEGEIGAPLFLTLIERLIKCGVSRFRLSFVFVKIVCVPSLSERSEKAQGGNTTKDALHGRKKSGGLLPSVSEVNRRFFSGLCRAVWRCGVAERFLVKTYKDAAV